MLTQPTRSLIPSPAANVADFERTIKTLVETIRALAERVELLETRGRLLERLTNRR